MLLILIYLGLSKSFAPAEKKYLYINNIKDFREHFPKGTLTIILTNCYQTGLIIKTYFMKIKMVQGHMPPYVTYLRTSSKFWKDCQQNIGLSLYRRNESKDRVELTLAPPGFIFLDDYNYGRWRTTRSGMRIWKFNRRHKQLPLFLDWKNSYTQGSPSIDLYKKVRNLINLNLDYTYSTNDDFLPYLKKIALLKKQDINPLNYKKILRNFIYLPKWKRESIGERSNKK